MIKKVGFMQGRLSDPVNGLIQAFPIKDWQDEFKTAEGIGITLMEWTLDSLDLDKNPLLTKEGQRRIVSLIEKYNLRIDSLTGDCFMQNPFWKENPINKEILKNQFIKICKACSKLKIKIIVIPLVDNGSLENKVQEDEVVNYLNQKTKFLESLDIKVAFESDLKPDELKHFIDRFPVNQFGINYDTGNSASMGFDSSEEFSAYGKRIINVHIKDRVLGGQTVPLKEGSVDFDSVFKGLSKINYSGNFILQTARSMDGSHANLIKSYHELTKKYIHKYIST
ncbi:sugar phosphate isomerase/epimerase [Prochlorococcus sp. MIT 1223]|uniref:sugar phosphate isomerase/epimerase family protein n=1 Tax=Prochlorococcus sp. MIT 1223 TaxID=3096217 RepID=UPI002A75C53A|nr:sugar phosphate isomerase/epimerase [Prochlorococcus sp. MIT 1223]